MKNFVSIYFTAIISAEPEHQDEIKAMLEGLPEHSKKEASCIQYDVHQRIDDVNTFLFDLLQSEIISFVNNSLQ